MKSRTVAFAALAVGATLALFIGLLASSDTQRSGSFNFEIVGKVAPPIQGTTLSGEFFNLQDLRGDWVVVNFFASWCVGCRVEHPELVAFTESHVDDGVHLVSIMFGDTEEDARRFFDELGGDWPTLVSDIDGIQLDYGVTGVPETLLVAPSGRVVQKWISSRGVTQDQLDSTIAQLAGNA